MSVALLSGFRWSSVMPVVFVLCMGCFHSHGRDDSRDAGPRDARAGDTIGRLDAGAPSCRFERVSEQLLQWQAIDCGSAKQPGIVAAGGLFRVLMNEDRACDDRPALLWSNEARLEDGVLVTGEDSSLGFSFGRSYAAARRGAEVGVCNNEQLFIEGPTRDLRTEELRPAPMDFPGCSQALNCEGLAFDGRRWVAAWGRFECDVVLHELTRQGGPSTLSPVPSRFAVHSLVALRGRSAALSLDFDRTQGELILWNAEQPEPTLVHYEGANGGAGLSRWPFDDGAYVLAIAVGEDLEVRWLNERGEELRRRRYDAVLGRGPMAVELRITAADFGVMIVGSRRGGLHSVVAIDRSGTLLHASQMTVTLSDPSAALLDITADVAAIGNSVVVHLMGAGESDQSQLLLYRCE